MDRRPDLDSPVPLATFCGIAGGILAYAMNFPLWAFLQSIVNIPVENVSSAVCGGLLAAQCGVYVCRTVDRTIKLLALVLVIPFAAAFAVVVCVNVCVSLLIQSEWFSVVAPAFYLAPLPLVVAAAIMLLYRRASERE
ncbi:MAG: hypothetical protein H7062_03995 [Candidatus Saccharimonas sp.]|nr:hypothetical protein [Planctomycetaceae bacterium]